MSRAEKSIPPRRSNVFLWPLGLSLVVLLSQLVPLAPLRDAVSLKPASQFSLSLPFWHVVFTPFCSLADALTMNGAEQHKVLFVWIVLACLSLRSVKKAMTLFTLAVLFFCWGIFAYRPSASLVSRDSDVVLVDFHSHTEESHDGRAGFDAAANMRWHNEQGYDAAFITDHNRNAISRLAKDSTRRTWAKTGYRSLDGEELSLFKTHLVVLGNHDVIDPGPFNGNPSLVKDVIRSVHAKGLLVIAALPEYWEYHWPEAHTATWRHRRLTADEGRAEAVTIGNFIDWGIDGFEVLNGDPNALDFPLEDRSAIIELCRRNNLLVTGASDVHGYGRATAVWNAVRIPGWRNMAPDALEDSLLTALHEKRFGAVQVIERAHFIPANRLQRLLSPVGMLIVYWRTLQFSQVLAWLGWIWAAQFVWLLFPWARRTSVAPLSFDPRLLPYAGFSEQSSSNLPQ